MFDLITTAACLHCQAPLSPRQIKTLELLWRGGTRNAHATCDKCWMEMGIKIPKMRQVNKNMREGE
jgi:hypothetical protein